MEVFKCQSMLRRQLTKVGRRSSILEPRMFEIGVQPLRNFANLEEVNLRRRKCK